ncbi:MAG: N-acetyltransferase [Shewanella sp.]|nr:N-acetyltransferase [Shewanella sp.]MCF1430482.1 N-acetyltransferase [Shewanella sp.]MCF1439516.1 N-acetyltransferase [Shewanella sp.]MCF1457757.1 N-acetyltransferase [Shewanella sp.]
MDVSHEQNNSRFVLTLDGHLAELEYRLSGQDVDFSRTFVPPELRGKGVAEKLVRAGLAWAKEQHLNISASCWYVQKFLR